MNARAAAQFALAASLTLLTTASVASADSMDPALERLVSAESAGCRDASGRFTPVSGSDVGWCLPDDVAFKKLMSQWGFAFAPSAMHSARTTGYGGFQLTLEGAFTQISNGADYWKRGTRGEADAQSGRPAFENASPEGLLQLYSVKLRKGFGFGLELAGSFGFMPKTQLFSGGADVRLALLEGFRTGGFGMLPDIAVGGGVRTVTGTPQFQLTVAAVDAQISKPITVHDFSVLTPWLGYQHLWIFGDSGLVDLTPATDAQGYCGYAGSNVPGNPDPRKLVSAPGSSEPRPYYDGKPVCTSAAPDAGLDFNNNAVFEHARLERHRLIVGLNYRYEIVVVGAQFVTDIVKPAEAQSSSDDDVALTGEARQWSTMFELGAAF
jgi:hypothetical protein